MSKSTSGAKSTAKKSSKKTAVVASPTKQTVPFRFAITIGLLFIVAGFLLSYQPLIRNLHQKQPVAHAPAPAPIITPEVKAATKDGQAIEGNPVRIVVPALNIDLKIIDGSYDSITKTWTLTRDKAQYALMTPKPNNQGGNTFIYGHARPEVFAQLPKLPIGAVVSVYTDNNHVFTYRYRSSYETNPNDDSLFQYKGAPILTLQTCSGLWYQNRLLMTFDLVRVV